MTVSRTADEQVPAQIASAASSTRIAFRSCFATEQTPTITIVLLHGLLRTPAVMKRLSRRLEQATGWKTTSLGYPSRSLPIQGLAAGLAEEIKQLAVPNSKVFAITHSLGGVVLRHMMSLEAQGGIAWAGCILLAPPNNGSAVARTLSQAWGIGTAFGAIYGRAGVELGLEAAENCTWPEPPQPCAVIAGTQPFGWTAPVSWLTSALHMLPGGSDGTVAVEETKLNVMCAFATVHATHAAVINHPRTEELILSFLQHGKFDT